MPLPEWPARPATWPTKEQDDEATHLTLASFPVKDVECAIQRSESNGGFQCFDSGNLVKYKPVQGLAEQCIKIPPSVAEDVDEDNLCIGQGQPA